MRTFSYQLELIIPPISPGLNLSLFISSMCMIDEFAMVSGPGWLSVWALQIKYRKFRLALPEDLAWFPVLLFFKRRNKARWAPLRSTQICQHASPCGRYFLDLLFTFIYFCKNHFQAFSVTSSRLWLCFQPADENRFYWCLKESIRGAKFCLYLFTSALQKMTRAKPDWGTFRS